MGVSTQYDDTVMMNVESHQLALRSILGVISDFTEEDVKGALREKLAFALRDALMSNLRHSEILEDRRCSLYLPSCCNNGFR